MTKYRVNYSMDVNFEIVVEAKNAEEAERMVSDGSAFLDVAEPVSEEFLQVNNVELDGEL